jgi:phage-related protein
MPTIKDKIYFNFDGVWSDTYELLSVVLDGGMYDETLVATREITETKMRGSSKPLFHGFEDSPLDFDMNIAFEDGFDDDKINSIIGWLFADNYKPLFFEGKEDKVYYCMPTNDARLIHNGLSQGYFTIHMRCDSSMVYSPTIITNSQVVSTTNTITIENDGHFIIYPEISILKNGVGTITIESLDDNGNIFDIRDLTDIEDIYINCEKEIIQTDAIGVYRYDKIVGDFPRIIIGTNRFKITGACTIEFRYKARYKF